MVDIVDRIPRRAVVRTVSLVRLVNIFRLAHQVSHVSTVEHVVRPMTTILECIISLVIVLQGKNNMISLQKTSNENSFFLKFFSYTGLYCQEKQECPKTFYGDNCSVQCIAPNTCSQGHFTCNFKGEKNCLEGWGPINVCNQKLLAPIFDPECPISSGCLHGGTCFNGSCCCPTGYTGKLSYKKSI